jgi:hypothetical protein
MENLRNGQGSLASTFDESVVIQDHKIRFITVNLTASASDIRAELLRVTSYEICPKVGDGPHQAAF